MRILALMLSFYLTFAIAQIPFVQSLMPESVQEIVAASDVGEDYFLSIVVPGEYFDPQDVFYYEGLVAMKRGEVEDILADIPGMHKVDTDYYVYEGETIDIDISLYTGDYYNQITEIEFTLPAENLAATPEVVDIMLHIAYEIPNTQIFDYNHEKLYRLEEYELLMRDYSEDEMGTRILFDTKRQLTPLFLMAANRSGQGEGSDSY